MITVRFPTGFSIQYNDATYGLRNSAGYTDIYTEKGGTFIAQAPNDCLIEWVGPCRTYNAIPAEPDALLALTKEIRLLKRKLGVKP